MLNLYDTIFVFALSYVSSNAVRISLINWHCYLLILYKFLSIFSYLYFWKIRGYLKNTYVNKN